MANRNHVPGLAQGVFNRNASLIVNCISDNQIEMGDVVILSSTIQSKEIFPRVTYHTTPLTDKGYGITVNGDADGIYGDGSQASDDSTKATTGAGQGIAVCVAGRCMAKVESVSPETLQIGDKLTLGTTPGVLIKASTGQFVVGIALSQVAIGDIDMIPIEVSREGAL